MLSALMVNAGNYLYNVLLGRTVSPEIFAETGLLVTLLLILSFLGMAFQLVTAKYIVEIGAADRRDFQKSLSWVSIASGLLLGGLMWFFSPALTSFLNLSAASSIKALALGVPFYFYLSVMRGFLQGQEQFVKLSISYQAEMLSRFAITILLIYSVGLSEAASVALSISASIIIGALTCGKPVMSLGPRKFSGMKALIIFFLFTGGYELVQMLTNYFDLILVKHYFSEEMAGLYTALSLIGRMIYFITWMFVMLLIPEVVNTRKAGHPYQHLLNKYLKYIGLLIAASVVICAICPEFIVSCIFGKSYLSIGQYLWMYALATGMLALGNIFTYYYLSLGNYKPVMIMGVFAVLQIVTITFLHNSFNQIIYLQIIYMGLALMALVGYHYVEGRRQKII
jgi:O-antigen/teichoic acid export membrane protein